jgi:ABC-type multidrug transport system fused ATPase/permease subunit
MRLAAKFWSVLSPHQKRSAAGLLGLMILSTLFEMLGIGLIVPGLSILAGKNSEAEAGWQRNLLDILGNPSRSQIVMWGAVGLLGIYVLKAVVVMFTTYQQAWFVRNLDKQLCERLFTTYLRQPWAFHLQRNSADMIRTITSAAGIADACASILNATAELMILAGIGTLLLWLDPVATVIVGVLAAVSTWLLDRIFKVRSRRWGSLRLEMHGKLTKTVHQGLGGVKDAKIRGCESYFIAEFSRHAGAYASVCQRQAFASIVPRLWHELVGIAALCLVTLILVLQGRPLEQFIPTLGLFAAAGFRILPAINRLSTALQMINYWGPTVEETIREVSPQVADSRVSPALRPMTFSRELVLEGLGFQYPGAASPALHAVNLAIPCGTSVGVIGASGAGKSTLVDIILGLLSPSHGRVLIDGVDLKGNERSWQRLVGYVPQAIYLCDDTIRANVAFGIASNEVDEKAVIRAIRVAQLDEFVAELPDGLATLVGERGVRLSGGQRQRIGIARALYHDPRLLVLDEATSALDTETERGVMNAVEALHGNKTMIIVAHRFSTVANCDTLYRLEKGRVVSSGNYNEVVCSLAVDPQTGQKAAT